MNDRIKPLEGVRNFRDFGGYATEDGGRVRPGLLFRSGHYAEATEGDVETLDSFGVVFQADLRRPDERERQVNRWPGEGVHIMTHDGGRETQSPHVQFLHEVEASAEAADDWMNQYYLTAPFRPHHVELFQGWFDRLAGLESEEAAVVNCAAGKDRTGILCALTLTTLGVGEVDIWADYELTNQAANIADRLPEATAYFNDMLGKAYDADVYRPFLGVRGRYLTTAFEAIKSEAGSVEAYLSDTLGVDDGKRRALRERLVER